MQFNNIEQIKGHMFVGNTASDALAFEAIDVFVKNSNIGLQDKAEALRVRSDKGMGLGREENKPNWQIVLEYLRSC